MFLPIKKLSACAATAIFVAVAAPQAYAAPQAQAESYISPTIAPHVRSHPYPSINPEENRDHPFRMTPIIMFHNDELNPEKYGPKCKDLTVAELKRWASRNLISNPDIAYDWDSMTPSFCSLVTNNPNDGSMFIGYYYTGNNWRDSYGATKLYPQNWSNIYFEQLVDIDPKTRIITANDKPAYIKLGIEDNDTDDQKKEKIKKFFSEDGKAYIKNGVEVSEVTSISTANNKFEAKVKMRAGKWMFPGVISFTEDQLSSSDPLETQKAPMYGYYSAFKYRPEEETKKLRDRLLLSMLAGFLSIPLLFIASAYLMDREMKNEKKNKVLKSAPKTSSVDDIEPSSIVVMDANKPSKGS